MQVIVENEVVSLKKDLDRVIVQLVSKEEITKYQEGFPYINYLDMVILFYFVCETNDSCVAKFLVHNSDFELFGLDSLEQLYKIAISNTQRLFPSNIDNLYNVIKSMLVDTKPDMLNVSDQIYVASNQIGVNGATVILYPGLLDDFSEKTGYDKFYLLPSSKHEFLFVRDDGKLNATSLAKMVEEINTTQVIPAGDFLSNNIYYYDSATKSVTIVN